MNPLDWLDYSVLGNPLSDWGIGAAILVSAGIVLALLRKLFRTRLGKLAEHTGAVAPKIARHVVGQTKGWFIILVSLFLALRPLEIPEAVDEALQKIIIIGLILQMGIWAAAGIGRFVRLRREAQIEDDAGAVAAMDLMGFLARVAVWTIVLLLTLDNLGVNITALVAGLGVGGIAIALAAQNIIGDLFASLSIVLDKPFVVGDFLVIDAFSGNVEKVGLKTTRIRSLSGEQLVFSNTDLLNSRIRNYGRMFERRINFKLGVIYQTPAGDLERIPEIIRDIIDRQDKARFDRAHFQGFGDFSLNFEIVYFVESSEYRLYMDIQQAVNLEIYRRFNEEGIEFAYPTQTVYVSRDGEDGRQGD